MTRRIKVKGIRKSEIDTEQLALIYWLPSGCCVNAASVRPRRRPSAGSESDERGFDSGNHRGWWWLGNGCRYLVA
jgi:hypothetical protein